MTESNNEKCVRAICCITGQQDGQGIARIYCGLNVATRAKRGKRCRLKNNSCLNFLPARVTTIPECPMDNRLFMRATALMGHLKTKTNDFDLLEKFLILKFQSTVKQDVDLLCFGLWFKSKWK